MNKGLHGIIFGIMEVPLQSSNILRGWDNGDPTHFHFLVWQATNQNLLQGVKIGKHQVEVNLLQFVDDTLLCCETNHQNVFRVCLVKSIFTILPLCYFYLNLQYLFVKLLQRNFLWDWESESKDSLIRWEILCMPKHEGGLSIRGLSRFNTTLLAKWKWRMRVKSTWKWRNILLSRYGNPIDQNQHCAVKSQS